MSTFTYWFRGWFPHWEAQMRAWNLNDFIFYGIFLLAVLMTVHTVRSK